MAETEIRIVLFVGNLFASLRDLATAMSKRLAQLLKIMSLRDENLSRIRWYRWFVHDGLQEWDGSADPGNQFHYPPGGLRVIAAHTLLMTCRTSHARQTRSKTEVFQRTINRDESCQERNTLRRDNHAMQAKISRSLTTRSRTSFRNLLCAHRFRLPAQLVLLGRTDSTQRSTSPAIIRILAQVA